MLVDISLGEHSERPGIDLMFNLQNLGRNHLRCVTPFDRDLLLKDDRSVVEFFVNEMYRCSAGALPIGDDRLMHVHSVHSLPSVFREECGMNIDDPIPESRDDPVVELFHVSRQCDEIHVMVAERVQHRLNKRVPVWKHQLTEVHRRYVIYPCQFQNAGAGVVTENKPDPNIGKFAALKSIQYRLEV